MNSVRSSRSEVTRFTTGMLFRWSSYMLAITSLWWPCGPKSEGSRQHGACLSHVGRLRGEEVSGSGAGGGSRDGGGEGVVAETAGGTAESKGELSGSPPVSESFPMDSKDESSAG